MNKFINFKIYNIIYLSIYIALSLIVTIFFFIQWYNDLNSFLSFYSLFSLWIIWEIILWKLNNNIYELLIIIFSNLFLIFIIISLISNKLSRKNMYIFIIILSLLSILLWITLLSLGIWM